MNLVLPKEEKISKKAVALYSVAIIVCIVSIILLVCSYYSESKNIDHMTLKSMTNTTQEELDEELLKSEFKELFKNRIENDSINMDEKKIEQDKDIVYTKYQVENSKENKYYIDIKIPYINLNDDFAKKYNEQIDDIFVTKAKNILKMEEGNVIYSVQYEANVEDGILFLMIKSDLKENSSAQRVIIQTYQYDLEKNKEISFNDLIESKQLDKQSIQNKIKNEIQSEQKKVEDLKSLGYNIFERNVNDEMYNIENIQEFFVKDGKIYVIYAYGNDNLTSEMDLVII